MLNFGNFQFKKKIRRFLGPRLYYSLKYIAPEVTPSTLRIDITASCNAKCPFCPREYMPDDRTKGFMALDDFEKICIDARAIGIKKIKLYITSEPTLHRNFSDIIEKAKAFGFYVVVSTNASTMHKYFADFTKVDEIQFSVEGWDKESFERFRTPLKFDKVYSNIKTYSEEWMHENQKTSIHALLTRTTDVEKLLLLWGDFVSEIKLDFMQPSILFRTGRMDSVLQTDLASDYFEFERQVKDFYCFDPFDEVTIGYDGKILLCCLDFTGGLELGHASEGLKVIHNTDTIKSIRQQFITQSLDTCAGCSQFFRPTQEAVASLRKAVREFEKKHSISAKIKFAH